MTSLWRAIAAHIASTTGRPFTVQSTRGVGGGCINQAYHISDADRAYFVKLNAAARLAMFEAEARGLSEMHRTQTIAVPQPICWGVAEGSSFLVLQWLELGPGSAAGWQALGHHLAAMHRITSPHGFGWDQPNTIGETPQPNPWSPNWAEFYQQQRLGHQFQLAQRRGGHFPRQAALLAVVPELLRDRAATPSLVHGDLWSGNVAITQTGTPVIFDPATYYGDREVDIAMSELFGRFPAAFYQAYSAAYPLAPGYPQRRELYNLYHVLNHFTLFGGSYAAQANRMIDQLLSEA
jgi:fructosamine-3-kinase